MPYKKGSIIQDPEEEPITGDSRRTRKEDLITEKHEESAITVKSKENPIKMRTPSCFKTPNEKTLSLFGNSI